MLLRKKQRVHIEVRNNNRKSEMREDVKRNSFIHVIQRAKKNNNLAFFIGSGFSSSENPSLYKGWTGIISELLKSLDSNEETDNLKIAQIYKLKFGPIESKNNIRSFFPALDVPSQLQQSLIEYNADYIITTNWDKLLENAVNQSLTGYDVIASDTELVESTNKNKLIKMHGDFEHDNFVFTEQDYLDYSINFPLIENFIKSILSTHVCVLFGYSFNDIDFKQIVNWLHNNSEKQLPIYMICTETKSKDECKYLETFGINTVQISDDNNNSKNDFISFFKLLENKNYEDYLDEPEKYIYEKLSKLDIYPNILQSQIKETLTNCGFVYDSNNFTYLCFHDLFLTLDQNDELRELFQSFYNKIEEYEKSKNEIYLKIKKILMKADIYGITRDSKFRNNEAKAFVEKQIESYSCRFDFDFTKKKSPDVTYIEKMNTVFSLYSVERYEEAFQIIKSELLISKLNKDYTKLLVCMINYNVILQQLKMSLTSKETSKKYENMKEIDIDNEFSKMSSENQEEVRSIYEFTNFRNLYKRFYNVQNNLERIRERKFIVLNKSFSNSEECGTRAIHKNLVDFVVNNGICIEDYTEYKSINEKYFEISLINTRDNKWIPNKTELYTAIKYIKPKDMKDVVNFFTDKPVLSFSLSDENYDWLVNTVLENCIQNYCNRVGMWSKLEAYVENTILLLSILHHNKVQTDNILNKFNKLVKNTHNTIQVFDEISLFLGIQLNVFGNKNIDGEKALAIIETLLTKFISNDISGYEDFAISQNRLSNLLGCASLSHIEFKNKDILSKFLTLISHRDKTEKLDMAQGFILQLYCISNSECKELIKEFVKGNLNAKESEDIDYLANYYSFKIYLHLIEIEKLEDSFISEVEMLVEKLPKGVISSRYNLLNFRLKQIAEKETKYHAISDKLDKFIKDGINYFNQFMGNKE